MNNFNSDKLNEHEVGEVILIGTEEWTISEKRDGKYILYHEGISGTSHTKEMTPEELSSQIVDLN